MAGNSAEKITQPHCIRFGVIAVRKGLVSAEDLRSAIDVQVQEDLEGKPHRLIGGILFDLDLMTTAQIDEVLNELFDKGTRG